jgi:hypothetical protein
MINGFFQPFSEAVNSPVLAVRRNRVFIHCERLLLGPERLRIKKAVSTVNLSIRGESWRCIREHEMYILDPAVPANCITALKRRYGLLPATIKSTMPVMIKWIAWTFTYIFIFSSTPPLIYYNEIDNANIVFHFPTVKSGGALSFQLLSV